MKKIIRTAGILTLVFAASVAVYFFAARKNMQKEEAVYSSMNAPEFPVVYTEFDGKDIKKAGNPCKGIWKWDRRT